jgi:Tol biopolymer transport system component
LPRALAIVLVVAALCRRAHAGDPTRVWRTVETDHFVIYYYAPLDDVARRVGVVSERAHRILSPALDHVPTEKTLIYLADDVDAPNGFAAVLPRNAIQLYATGPNAVTELDDHDDWLFGLVAHEYTHILHLDTVSNAPAIYNRIFGKTWAPSQLMPRWLIEGIAVYEESKRSAGGRNRGSRFDQIIRIARHAVPSTLLRLDQVSGDPRQFPRGNAVYIYGSHFLQYVFDRFGDDTLRKMSHLAGGYAPPFALNRQIAKVVGRPFTELYDDWTRYLRDKYAMQEMAAERRGLARGRALTHSAEGNYLAHYSADGKELVWLQYDGYTLPMVRAMPVGADSSRARDVVQIDAMGPFDLLPDGSFVYEQTRQFRRDYYFEDLFRWDARTGETVRITHGRRARDPSVSPDGRRLAFSKNEYSESVLAVMDLAPDAAESIVWRGQRYDQAYQPAWSPDGTRLAFSAWRKDGYRDILIVELASGQVVDVTHDRAIDMSPAWSRDGRWLYFDSDRTGISNIYCYDTRDRAMWQVTNVIGGAFRPNVSPDNSRIAFEAAVPAGGYDLYELPIDRATWLPARDYFDAKPPPVHIPDDETRVSAPRPYRALETLAPQTWTLNVTTNGTSPTASIQTGGSDAVGLHGYSLAISEDLQHGDTDIGASYGYSGLRPSINISGARTLLDRGGWKVDGVSKTFKEEDWSGTVAVGIPFEQRPSSSWTLSFDYSVDWFRLAAPPAMTLDPNQRVPTHPPTDYVESGVGARLAFSNVRSTTFALGSTSGFDFSTSLRLDDPAFGSAYRAITVSYGGDAYQRLGSATSVLAERLVGGLRAGDLIRPGGFGLGGVPPQDVAMAIVNSQRAGPIGYLRGFKPRSVTGNQFHLLNVEYRRELFRIEHGISSLPIYFRRVNLGVMSDTGTAFDGDFTASRDLRASFGAALRLDAFFGYFVPGTFEIGYSRGVYGAGAISETWFILAGSL